MWGNCEDYTFEECVKVTGLNLNITDDKIDAELLCGVKSQLVFETVSAAAVAIVAYLVTNFYIQVAECSVLLKLSSIWGKGMPHRKEANRAILYSYIINGVIATLLYGTSVGVVSVLVHPLDNRTNQFIVGLSQVFAAIVFLMMSVHVPQWFGIYHSRKDTTRFFASGKGIRFGLSWSLWKQIFSMYFFALYFACADFQLSLVYGAMIGFAVGIFSVFITTKARSKQFANHKGVMAGIVIAFYTALSWYIFYTGVSYISNIWLSNEDNKFTDFYISLIWVSIMIVTHLLMYLWTNKKRKQGRKARFTSMIFHQGKFKSIYGHAGFLSNESGKEGKIQDDDIEKEVSRSDSLEELGKEGKTQNGGIEKEVSRAESLEDDIEKKQSRVRFPEDKQSRDSLPEDGNEKIKPRVNFSTEILEKENSPMERSSEVTEAVYISPKNAPSYFTLLMNKMTETYPCLCCCLVKEYGVDSISPRRLETVVKAHELTKTAAIIIGFKRFAWYLLSFAALFFTIVNIGATYQQCAAKNALPATFELLYPPDYLDAEMCAWDAPGPNATIKTFTTRQDVYDAGFEVIHCGTCGKCSNWNDITLQYTSRKYLAAITKVCAMKSIGRRVNVTDPNDSVVMCNRLQVGFTTPCAMSWAWDEIHTKNHAIFVFIQATVSNFAADMEVTYQDITMATIDEALSGPRFVKEVGATRRRMDIVSDIRRPITQQCSIVKQNWSEIFVDPFKPPVGGTYTVQSPGKPKETFVVIGQDTDPS